MKKNLHLLAIIFLSCIVQVECEAQNKNNNSIWYFGDHAGIDFRTGSPVVLTNSAMYDWDVAATACNTSGELLMYCNGDTVWNKNHQLMPNGTGLLGSTTGGQTSLILNQYETENYYVFTVAEFAVANGLRYSVVDLSLNGGTGDIVAGKKNVPLVTPSTEKIAAVWNRTNYYYWVITHQWNNNTFACYKLNASGLDTIPVLNSVGTSHTGGTYGGIHNAMGQLVVSPDGTHLACALSLSGLFELFDFDINTGVISNPITISGYPNALGLAYSSNGQLIYLTRLISDPIYQFDLSNYTQTAIANSVNIVGHVTSSGAFFGYTAAYLHLAPDAKIYVPHIVDSVVGAIEYPNLSGTSCNYIDHFLNLQGMTSNPGMTQGPVYTDEFTGIEKSNFIHFSIFPNPSFNSFTIKLPSGLEAKNVRVHIISVDGKLEKEITINSNRDILFSRDELSPGIYFCELTEGKKIIAVEKIAVE